MNPNPPSLVMIGEIVRVHGLRGMVKVRATAEEPEQFSRLQKILLQRGTSTLGEYCIEAMQLGHDGIFIKFREVDDRNQAEHLRGAQLMIPREECLPAAAGQFYQFELVGLPVYKTTGEFLGEIAEVMRYPANDVWVIRRGQAEKLIPAIDSVIQQVDLPNRRVVIAPLPGLLEDES
ncbi:MAG: Ribosome maturation factor RimM [bacterium]|nr:Ribosome maturation factor RimM [bacterium]